VNLHESPRVVATSPPSQSPTLSPSTLVRPPPQPAAISCTPLASAPTFHITPCRLVFGDDHSPRVVSAQRPFLPPAVPVLPVLEPIAQRTRSRAPATLALFASGGQFHYCIQYHIPTAKLLRAPSVAIGFAGLCVIHHMSMADTSKFATLWCSALLHKDNPLALSVLNPTTSDVLEHCQLQCDPWYKMTWDTSYFNELGHLCQGIGSGEAPNSKCVAGTNTFFCINYSNIPLHKRKEICHTIVVCEVRPEKDDPNCTQITIGGNCIFYPGNVGTNTA
jgi:hypothetical protein